MKKTNRLTKQIGTFVLASMIVSSNILPAYASATTSTAAVDTSSPQKFIESVADYAKKVATENDLYPSVMIAQMSLESGYGKSTLSQAPNYNFFGIKFKENENDTSDYVEILTKENDGTGKLVDVMAKFRKYPSYKESMDDYAKFFKRSPWFENYYRGVFRSNTTNYKDATAALQGTYATDGSYAEKLNRVIEQYNLTQYDGDYTIKKTEIRHLVVKGDSLYSIANKYNTTVAQIKEWNLLTSDLIIPGSQLVVGYESEVKPVVPTPVVPAPVPTPKPEVVIPTPTKLSVTGLSTTVNKDNVLTVTFDLNKGANVEIVMTNKANNKLVVKAKSWETAGKKTYTYKGNKLNDTYTYEIRIASDATNVVQKTGTAKFTYTAPVVSTPTPATVQKQVSTNGDTLNVRSGAGVSYKILGTLKNKAVVTVTNTSNGWSYIQSGTLKGWVNSSYLKNVIVTNQPTIAPTTPATKQAKVTATSLNMRSSASLSGKVVGYLQKNNVVTVEKVVGDWSYVVYGTKKGYVSNAYLTSIVTSTPTISTPSTTTATYTVKKGDTLWSIATKNKLTVAKLQSLNLLKTSTITVGMKLKLK